MRWRHALGTLGAERRGELADSAQGRWIQLRRVETSPASRKRRVRVLVVDDDSSIRNVIALGLESEGHVAVVASDGRAALDLLADARPDVIVMDVRMPVMDGFEFARRYRAQGGRAPIVVLTALNDMEAVERELRPDRILQKPFDLDEMLQVVGSLAPREHAERS